MGPMIAIHESQMYLFTNLIIYLQVYLFVLFIYLQQSNILLIGLFIYLLSFIYLLTEYKLFIHERSHNVYLFFKGFKWILRDFLTMTLCLLATEENHLLCAESARNLLFIYSSAYLSIYLQQFIIYRSIFTYCYLFDFIFIDLFIYLLNYLFMDPIVYIHESHSSVFIYLIISLFIY